MSAETPPDHIDIAELRRRELLPCPFCGGEAGMYDIGNEHTKRRATVIWCQACRFRKRVGTIRNNLTWTRRRAVEAWNQRAPSAARWECGARKSVGANDPQDCGFPHCGCCPDADEVIHALAESGELMDDGTIEKHQRALDRIEALEAENTVLRGLVQCNPDWRCPYGQPVSHIAECPHGFPGCACADDRMAIMMGGGEAKP